MRYRRGSKRFSRAIIRPVNNVVEVALGPSKVTAIKAELAGKTTKDRVFAMAFGERLWPVAAEILADFVKRATVDGPGLADRPYRTRRRCHVSRSPTSPGS